MPIRYVDFASWQRRKPVAGEREDLFHHWRVELHGLPLLILPIVQPQGEPSIRCRAAYVELEPGLVLGLEHLSRSGAPTLHMPLVALVE